MSSWKRKYRKRLAQFKAYIAVRQRKLKNKTEEQIHKLETSQGPWSNSRLLKALRLLRGGNENA